MAMPLPEEMPALPPDASHKQLIERAILQHSKLVSRIAYNLLRRPEDVNDLVQDVFVAALQAGPRLSLCSSLGGWLATVTVRSAAKRLRRRRLARALGLDSDLSYEHVGASGADAETQISAARLASAIAELPEELELAWILRHVDGESLANVAKLCDCSLSTAKRRIQAAQAKLRRSVVDGTELQ